MNSDALLDHTADGAIAPVDDILAAAQAARLQPSQNFIRSPPDASIKPSFTLPEILTMQRKRFRRRFFEPI